MIRCPAVKVLGSLFLFMFVAGCAGIKETVKNVAGVSTKCLEKGRADSVKKTYDLGYEKCRQEVEAVLAEVKAYIYGRDKNGGMIAFYMTESDTTPVGIFFSTGDGNKTTVEVSSPSRYSKEFISDKIAQRMSKQSRMITKSDGDGRPAEEKQASSGL